MSSENDALTAEVRAERRSTDRRFIDLERIFNGRLEAMERRMDGSDSRQARTEAALRWWNRAAISILVAAVSALIVRFALQGFQNGVIG